MRFKSILLLSLVYFAAVSCQVQSKKAKEEMPDKNGPEYSSAYICPMHCKGSGSDKPGTCPVCQMDYEPNEDLIQTDSIH
ncbi:MAG TPA: heavy metal-binding domain-containing protein [Saprospiraceae bacterium]|nr:heavy metal-binding domain-containing protein [Saprospiraceae bacterium]